MGGADEHGWGEMNIDVPCTLVIDMTTHIIGLMRELMWGLINMGSNEHVTLVKFVVSSLKLPIFRTFWSQLGRYLPLYLGLYRLPSDTYVN